jgi:hypothetical protein
MHSTHVKFTGTGYRASCATPDCRWYGQHFQLFRYLGTGSQARALARAQALADDDARRHRATEAERERKEVRRR